MKLRFNRDLAISTCLSRHVDNPVAHEQFGRGHLHEGDGEPRADALPRSTFRVEGLDFLRQEILARFQSQIPPNGL